MRKTPRVLMDLRGRMGAYAPAMAEEARRTLTRLAQVAGLGPDHEISLLLTDNPSIRRLNQLWRRIDKPTDVLSFPIHELKAGAAAPAGTLGDIVISLPYLCAAARELEIPRSAHLAHLLVHGLLHLLGFDHVKESEARRMEREEQRILGYLSIAGRQLSNEATDK